MTKSWHLYLIQFIHGLANSMAVPGWRILFTDHLDKGSTGYEWSLDDIVVGCSVAASAYIGANLAELFGYPTILIILSVMSFTAVLILIPLRSEAMSLPRLKQFLGRRKFFSRRRSAHTRSHARIKYGAV